MARSKKNKIIKQNPETTYQLRNRRSSMKVNLSYISTLTESIIDSSKKASIEDVEIPSELSSIANETQKSPVEKSKKSIQLKDIELDTSASLADLTVINARERLLARYNKAKQPECNTLMDMNVKEQQLEKTCMELKSAIMYKTQAYFDKGTELAIKTTEVLAKSRDKKFELPTATNVNEELSKRSPRVRVDIEKNFQILMSGDGKKKNPVQVNCMPDAKQDDDENESTDRSQSIVSTPKTSRKRKRLNIKKKLDECTGNSNNASKKPVARLFMENGASNKELPQSNCKETVVNDSSNHKTLTNSSFSTSPILSQGMRRFRLSLKKKISDNSCNPPKPTESFISSIPLTCSTFMDKQHKFPHCADKSNSTINLTDKSTSVKNNETLMLNSNKNKSIDEERIAAHPSSMEMTKVSSQMPIIRRSFQNIIRRSLEINEIIPKEVTKNCEVSPSKQRLLKTNDGKLSSTIKCFEPNELQEDCSYNTIRTSLNVNTSLDTINVSVDVTQKENKKPNSIKNKNNTAKNNSVDWTTQQTNEITMPEKRFAAVLEEESRIIQCQANDVFQKEKNGTKQAAITTFNVAPSSLQVNTSLDSKKKPVQEKLSFNKIISENISDQETYSSNSDLENVSLIKRIENKAKRLEIQKQNCQTKTNELESRTNSKNCSTSNLTAESSDVEGGCQESKTLKKNVTIKRMTRSSAANEKSIVEPTPYPTSRSFLYKTMIKKNIAAKTLNPKQFELSDTEAVSSTDENETDGIESLKRKNGTDACKKRKSKRHKLPNKVLSSSSDDSSTETEKEKNPIIIDESLNEPKKNKNKEFLNDSTHKKSAKRKLMKENSSLASFSPAEELSQVDTEKKKEKRKVLRRCKKQHSNLKSNNKKAGEITYNNVEQKEKNQKLKNVRNKDDSKNENENAIEDDYLDPEIPQVKVKKKPRKIISKKFVFKNAGTPKLLDHMMCRRSESTLSSGGRNSLREFDLTKMKKKNGGAKSKKINHKIIIVVTGLPKEDRDLLKSVVKALGGAALEVNVTPRTTHVISSGVRTINLLKGILRGCWLLTLEWALKSLESSTWLDPAPYEMCYFSKAVQENRRDRQLFGKAYVPDLFVTSGFMYVGNGTSPPPAVLKELIKTAGGRITEDPCNADILIGEDGLREIWILDSITTGEVQPQEQYKKNKDNKNVAELEYE